MRDHVFFFLNGEPQHVAGDDLFLTVSDFLRRRRGLAGTKVVCAEGDCGSCTVLIGRTDAAGAGVDYVTVTSCIYFVFQLDAAHLVTIEALGTEKALSPLQESMATCHAAQCGFCTPGFVVTLHDALTRETDVTSESVRRACVGNLCRCTGYDAITQAALRTDRRTLPTLPALFEHVPLAATLSAAGRDEVIVDAGARTFYKPVTVAAATAFLASRPGATLVAGATDLGVQCNKRARGLDVVVSTAGLWELRETSRHGKTLRLGAGMTLTCLEACALSDVPELGRFLAWFGSPQIKNAGTIGGNLAGGSPIADTIPTWYVLRAKVHLVGRGGTRVIPIESFYTGYRQTVLATGEMIAALEFDLPDVTEVMKIYKVSRRRDLDISTYSLACRLSITAGVVTASTVALGGVAATVVRSTAAEEMLIGKPFSAENCIAAGEAAAEAITPLSDVRGSAAYRSALVRNAFVKLYHDVAIPAAVEGER